MLAPVIHIMPLATIRRERLLPVPGRVVVRKGQKISATDVVAEARLAPEHMVLDLTRGLGLPQEEADRHIQCQPGARVSQGDLLAGPVGIAKRVVRAPKDGRVILCGEGQILLELDAPPYELRSGLPGTVLELLDTRGVMIETVGALIQGVWGNGRIDFGLMFTLIKSPDDELDANQLDVSMRGSIILGGYCRSADVLRSAAELPLRGLILASMDARLVSIAARMRFPVILLEGFGKMPMNPAAFRLLTTNERREVAINAEPWDRYRGQRPEVVITLPSSGEQTLAKDTEVFSSGQRVRIVRAPYTGATGTLLSLRPGLSTLPNGISARSADIRLEDGQNVVVPLANLEVLA